MFSSYWFYNFLFPYLAGVITVNQRIDYEETQIIVITVKATDSGAPSKSTTQQFLINVVNINDNSPIFEHPYYEGEMNENDTNVQVITTVKAIDLDRAPYGDVK